MKNIEAEVHDDLRPEYDLKSLRVRRVGAARKTISGEQIIQIALDVEMEGEEV